MLYGRELILDLKDCDVKKFTRDSLNEYFTTICNLLKLNKVQVHFWDYENEFERKDAPKHLAGVTAICFLTTSNITIHTLDKLKQVHINIFVCGHFDRDIATDYSKSFFSGKEHNNIFLER